MSAGREFHVCGAATENARRASSVHTLGIGTLVRAYRLFKDVFKDVCIDTYLFRSV